MKIRSESFDNNGNIDAKYAMGKQNPETHAEFSSNINPHLEWDDFPKETKSFVLICHDPDVPGIGDDVNQEGKTVSASTERMNFYHWVLVDIDPSINVIDEGEYSDGVKAGGKSGPSGPNGTRQGLNSYTGWFANDEKMRGNYFGYDGPFPPWNDEVMHRYLFTVYALDVEKCPVFGEFTGLDVLKAIEGHVLDKATLIGTYSLNPDVSYI